MRHECSWTCTSLLRLRLTYCPVAPAGHLNLPEHCPGVHSNRSSLFGGQCCGEGTLLAAGSGPACWDCSKPVTHSCWGCPPGAVCRAPAGSFLRCRAFHAYTAYLHGEEPGVLWKLSCQGCAGCTCWQCSLVYAMQSCLLSTSHVHTPLSLAVRLVCKPLTLALQVVEVSARYDDSCVAGSNNPDREGTLLQVRAAAATTAAHMHCCLQLSQQAGREGLC